MKCHYCDKTSDLRPYGPRGSMVCFKCAMSTPEREAETGKNFSIQLAASGQVAVIDGTEKGPYPAKHATNTSEKQSEKPCTYPDCRCPLELPNKDSPCAIGRNKDDGYE